MIREIVKDEELLSQPAEPATAEDAELAQDLLDTLESLKDECVGLAANMIGVSKAVIVLDNNGTPLVMFNPRIKAAKSPYKATEGCLSLPGRDTNVTRYYTIRVEYEELVDGALVKRKKQFQDFPAQIIQHEVDHLKGRIV